jgi:hypothetical protein
MRNIQFLVLVCVLVLSTSAQADTVGIDFDLGDSTMSFIGTINIPPDGTIHSMGATTILPANKTGGGATSVQTGSAQLKNLTLDMTIDAGSIVVAHITALCLFRRWEHRPAPSRIRNPSCLEARARAREPALG